jgi:hypothetical protein
MNKRGQFSIIAAMLVAVILIAAVMTTYSAIRYSQLQESPQVLSAVDEVNLALKQMLGFTVGYYGSVLKVTGNSSYARSLAANYLGSGLRNIGDIRPEWGTSFEVTTLELSTNWFTDESYSQGSVEVKYNLTGLGISNIMYSTSSRLEVSASPNSTNYAKIVVSKDENEPLVSLGRSNFKFYRYVYSNSAWELVTPASITSDGDGTYLLGIPSDVSWDSFTIEVEDSRGLIVTASSFNRYTLSLDWNENVTFPTENMVIEMLQNGTMRCLGQNLLLTTQTKPIPPIPIRSIHVSQTINGVSREVPFQVEDWASEYQIPLGLASDVNLFNNFNMIVFLVNIGVSKVTIWWDGSDEAVQTSLAYTNIYFDDPEDGASRTLNNGKLLLYFPSNGFSLTSRVIAEPSTYSTANLMKINGDSDNTASELAYVIVNGVVRDIVQGEAEWSGGVEDCPNVYSNIIITLPANVNYYTYQLRLIFIDSQQQRTIEELSPIELSSNFNTLRTENGTASGYPIVATLSGTFYNYSSGWTPHHWSQMSSGTRGAGIMFTDTSNQKLYAFDSIPPGTPTGALKVNSGSINLLPVTLRDVEFTNALDIKWSGAVVTYHNTTPIYQDSDQTGLWILAEYPPIITVTAES